MLVAAIVSLFLARGDAKGQVHLVAEED